MYIVGQANEAIASDMFLYPVRANSQSPIMLLQVGESDVVHISEV
jgi:hypothetical protein